MARTDAAPIAPSLAAAIVKSVRARVVLLLLPVLPASVCATALNTLPGSVAAVPAQAGVPESEGGVYVHNLTSEREMLCFGAGRALIPASVMKLLTTFAARELLGPPYAWKTEAWLDGKPDGNRLDGNLVLTGYGRLNHSAVAGQGHLKTGYIEGVRALADYTLDARDQMLAVVLIINRPRACDPQPVQDALLGWAYAVRTSLQAPPEMRKRVTHRNQTEGLCDNSRHNLRVFL